MFFLDLPVEILLCIADSLDQARDLLALACLDLDGQRSFPRLSVHVTTLDTKQLCLVFGRYRRGGIEISKNDAGRLRERDCNTTDGRYRTPILHAIRTKNETIIRTLLVDQEDGYQLSRGITTPHGLPPLGIMPLKGIFCLLHHFYWILIPCLDITDVKNRSAIWYAIAFCDENLVQVLLERGSDIPNTRLQTIFHIQPCRYREERQNYAAVTPSFRFQFKKDPIGEYTLSKIVLSVRLYRQAFMMSSHYSLAMARIPILEIEMVRDCCIKPRKTVTER